MATTKKSRLQKKKASYQRSVSKMIQKTELRSDGTTVVTLEKKSFLKNHLWEILAFILPFLFLGMGFIIEKIHPFGSRQFLVTDLWHQYYPFFQVLHEKLTEGGSLLYSWRTGLGTNFLSLMAYYCASPLNLLSVFVPQEYLREALMVILMLKFSFAGLFFARMLRYCFGRNDISICMFGVMYALCSYMMGYYWNVIWIDTVALLPLVMLGLTALVREGKYRTYVISLALALFCNYYIAYFICLFTVLAFFCLCLYEKLNLRQFGKRFALVAGGSLVGAGLSSWILIPAYQALQLTHSANNTFPSPVKLYESWQDIISNMLAFTEPTSTTGLPNLYCGLLPVLLLGVFLFAKNIRLREKITGVLLMVFLIVSCNVNVLNFIWHGFHVTNMLPYRFSFLFSFVVLVAAYRAYQILLEEKLSIANWIMLIVSAIAFCTVAFYAKPDESKTYIWSNVILAAIYIIIILLRKVAPKQLIQGLLAVVLAFEMGAQAINGVKTVGSSDYTSYPTKAEDIQNLVEQAEKTSGEYFYRTELTAWYTLNDPALYYFDGVSQFSSMANESITTFLRLMGLPAAEASNRYFYTNTSPLTNMLLSIRYILAKDGYNADSSMTEISQSGTVKMYENQYYLPIGYMMQESVSDFTFDTTMNAFEIQNAVFKEITGLDEELFTQIDITDVGHQGLNVTRNGYGSYQYTVSDDATAGNIFLKYNYTAQQDGMVYAYALIKQTNTANSTSNADFLTVYSGTEQLHKYNIGRQPYITPIGDFKAGERVTLRCDLEDDVTRGSATIYFYQLNSDVLDRGYAALSDEKLTLTSFSDTSFTGDITVQEDGYLYLSMPYESGWSAEVDGEKVEVECLFGAMCGIQLSAGTHSISLKYCPSGFVPGLMIAIGCVALLAVLWYLERRKGKQDALTPAETTAQDNGMSDSDPDAEEQQEAVDSTDKKPETIKRDSTEER